MWQVRSLCIALMGMMATPALSAQLVDRVVAIVDNDVITQQELDQVLADFRGNGSGRGGTATRHAAIEQLIDDRLIKREMDKGDVTIDDAELTEALRRFLQQNGITRDQLQQALAQRGMSMEGFERQISGQLRQMKFLQSTLGNEIQLSERELYNLYLRQQHRPTTASSLAQIRFAEIFLSFTDDATPRDQRRTVREAKKLAAAARAGDFAAVAKKHSQSPTAASGGDHGLVAIENLDPVLATASRRLGIGQVSDPIVTGRGVYIVKVLERPAAGQKDFEQYRPVLQQALYQSKMSGALTQYLGRLRAKAYIEILE
ncbi:MAG: peptidylprolyl isomerase [Deltaproteobacteria bacterium]|nr:peptidylprolyl isomerase [Deltaproteobacteria bacterium]